MRGGESGGRRGEDRRMSKHSKSLAEEGRSAVEVAEGEERGTNAGNRSNLLLPALYRKTHKNPSVHFFW